MPVLRVGVIGINQLATRAYLPGLHDPSNGVALVGICDEVRPENAERAARPFSAQNVARNVDLLLQTERPDLVFVLAPPYERNDLVSRCLMAGCHVFCERPFSLSLSGANDLCDLAMFQGRRLLSGPPALVAPEYEWLNEVLELGAAGDVRLARARASSGMPPDVSWYEDVRESFDPQRGGAIPPLYDSGIAALSVLTHCIGSPVTRVSALANIAMPERLLPAQLVGTAGPILFTVQSPDNCVVQLEYANGCLATLDISYCVRFPRGPRYEFHGTLGAVQFGGSVDLEVISEKPAFGAPADSHGQTVRWHPRPTPQERILTDDVSWGQLIVRHFLSLQGTNNLSPLDCFFARHILDVADKAVEAVRRGVTLPTESGLRDLLPKD